MAKCVLVVIYKMNEEPMRATGKVTIPLQRDEKGMITSSPNLDSVIAAIRRMAESDREIGAIIKVEKALPTDSP